MIVDKIRLHIKTRLQHLLQYIHVELISEKNANNLAILRLALID